ncbi:MAG TPA: tetratricopeptide repeat protein [Tepidisphaeraceae bacterium]|nr:tetratricopeptide repeat protein [Tepidisphaeraceae bacterium]
MAEITSEKLQKLMAMLQREPNDSFLLYGIGMEYKKLGDRDKALEFFARLIQADPGYCYAYYQQAQTYEQLGNVDQAKQSYREGIAAARRVGDAHAQSELEAALEMLS